MNNSENGSPIIDLIDKPKQGAEGAARLLGWKSGKGFRFNRFLRILGPGLITGAADDDPSGIATYSQAGAQFGYGQLWTVLFMLPLMTAVQEACARIGAVTGKGLAAVVRDTYSHKILYPVVGLVLIANTINIGADIGAMAEAFKLVLPVPFVLAALMFTVIILLLEVFTSYQAYAKVLKWLALSLLSYPITVLIVSQPWGELLRATFVPHIEFSVDFLFLITGVLGTTISPYMFFWQASEEVEEERAEHMIARDGHVRIGEKFIKKLRIDTFVGMIASEITTWSIIVLGGTVLHAHGLNNVATAADAAKALEPLVHSFPNSGFLAKLIFSTGIIGLGLLAVPVLSGSASYAISETFNWNAGLNKKLRKAHGFYGVITVATLIGLGINFIGIDPVQALVFTAVFNGVAAVPLLFLIAKLARSDKVMGEFKSGWLSNGLVWLTFIGMTAAAVAMFVSMGMGV
jgi:NRAMP (natural resistance-associated macrophage protein)-like metal ion transporter